MIRCPLVSVSGNQVPSFCVNFFANSGESLKLEVRDFVLTTQQRLEDSLAIRVFPLYLKILHEPSRQPS